MREIEYIPRQAVLAREKKIRINMTVSGKDSVCLSVVQVCDIEEIPAADVIRASGLTEDGRDLVKIWPEAVNELAERLTKKMDEEIIGGQGVIGRSIIADMTEADNGPA